MKYLFWNTQKAKINSILEDLIVDTGSSIVGLAEYTDDINVLLHKLTLKGLRYYHINKIGCERIDIIAKFTPGLIEHLNESSYYTIKKIPHEKLGFHLVAFVHLPSKKHEDDTDYLFYAHDLKKDIQEAEQVSNNSYTVIVGDFNMNPFENGMIAARGLHAMSSRRIAEIGSRRVKGETLSMFYNPMWNMFGDKTEPPGTYYYNRSNQINYYWHMFDQVVIRPTLLEHFEHDSLKIITSVNGISLVKKSGRPQQSDHLPIVFAIK